MILPNHFIVSTSSSLFRLWLQFNTYFEGENLWVQIHCKYLKNPKASVHMFFPLYMISHFNPKKAHPPVWPPFYSILWLGFGFFLLFSSTADYVKLQRSLLSFTSSSGPWSQQSVLRPRSKRSCDLFWTMEEFSGIRWRSILSGAEQRKTTFLLLGNCSFNF